MDDKEFDKVKKSQKDIDTSQKFIEAMKLKSDKKNKNISETKETRTIDDSQRFTIDAINFFKEKQERIKEESSKVADEKEQPKVLCMSTKFSLTPEYNKAMENTKVEKTPNRDKGDFDKE